VNNMHKELYKAGKSAIGPAILWIVGIYVFNILWGIGAILLEANPMPIIKHVLLWLMTAWYGWIIISKFLYEYELAARKHEVTLIKIMGKKSQTMLSVKYENIEALVGENEKGLIKSYSPVKKIDIVRAFQPGKKTYMIYKFDGKVCIMHTKMSRQMANIIRDNIAEKKGINQ